MTGMGNKSGHVRVYHMGGDGLSWKQLGQDIDSKEAFDWSGISVSLSNNGKTLAIGADNTKGENGEESGHVRVLHMDDDGQSWK